MASGDSLIILTPLDNTPPATLYATLDTMTGASTPAESVPVLDFDDTTVEYADFYCFMPQNYLTGGITLKFIHSAAAATGNVGWNAAFRAVPDDAEDLDTTSFSYDYNEVVAVVADTIGEVAYDNLTFTDGADMDSVAPGSYFILRIKRNTSVASDLTGDASLHCIEVKET